MFAFSYSFGTIDQICWNNTTVSCGYVSERGFLVFFCYSTSQQYDVVAGARHHTFSSGVSIGHMPHIHQGLPLAAQVYYTFPKKLMYKFWNSKQRTYRLDSCSASFSYIYIYFLRRRLPQKNTLPTQELLLRVSEQGLLRAICIQCYWALATF